MKIPECEPRRKKEDQRPLKRFMVPCIFKGWGRTRDFTTPGNFEAVNLLMNKLDRKGIVEEKGKLNFTFPTITEGEEQHVTIGIDCFYKSTRPGRSFYIEGEPEASEKLAEKLKEMDNMRGELAFVFISSVDSPQND